jgi:hypothetical protein
MHNANRIKYTISSVVIHLSPDSHVSYLNHNIGYCYSKDNEIDKESII